MVFFGAGFYFTPNKTTARNYGENTKETFLNARKPLIESRDNILPLLENLGYKKSFNNIDTNWLVDALKQSNKDFGILADVMNKNKDNKLTKNQYKDEFIKQGGNNFPTSMDYESIHAFSTILECLYCPTSLTLLRKT